MHLRDPYFSLRIQAESLPIAVEVNTAPLMEDRTGSVTDETWPINHMLRASGDNEISVQPAQYDDGGKGVFRRGAKVTLTVLVQEAGHLDRPGMPITKLCFIAAHAGTPHATDGSTPEGQFDSSRQLAPSKDGDIGVGKPKVRVLNAEGVLFVSRTFSAALPIREWEFLSSDVLPDIYNGQNPEAERTYDALLAAYEVIWKGLKSGNVDSIMPLFEERSTNTDRAFYLAPGTTQRKLKESFERVTHDPTLTLNPIRTDRYWELDIAPGGRLMRLVFGAHSSAILRFDDKDGLSTVYPVTFRRKGGKYIIAL
jgi:hypothetical protein